MPARWPQRLGIGGHAAVFLQYLVGLRRLGFDELFLGRLDAGMQAGEAGRRWLLDVL